MPLCIDRRILAVTLAVGQILSADGKVIMGTANLNSQTTELYMAKFSFSPYKRSYIGARAPAPRPPTARDPRAGVAPPPPRPRAR